MILDCGEDKNDDHREYAGTIAFHKYRQKETDFFRSVISNAVKEYQADDVLYKCVISHIPFMHTDFDPAAGIHEFDIEIDTYTEWVQMLNCDIKPDFGLFGHVHQVDVIEGSGKYNNKGFAAPIILGGKPENNTVYGCAVTLKENTAEILFTDETHCVVSSRIISLET